MKNEPPPIADPHSTCVPRPAYVRVALSRHARLCGMVCLLFGILSFAGLGVRSVGDEGALVGMACFIAMLFYFWRFLKALTHDDNVPS